MGTKLKITLVRSTIAQKPKVRNTIRSLGLNKIGQSVVKNDSQQIRGSIRLVDHLIRVEKV